MADEHEPPEIFTAAAQHEDDAPAKQSRASRRVRKIIFPTLKLIIFAMIAVALVKLAFFPSATTEMSQEISPGGQLIDPTVTVEIGDIVNDLTLDGSILRDPSQTVLATVQGEIGTIFVQEGETVARGERLYQIRTEHVPDPVEPTEQDPEPEQPQPYFTYADVLAPTSGTLLEFPFLVGMSVDIGTETGKIQPASFHIAAGLTAAQQYRFTNAPESATVTIQEGPAPFECGSVTIDHGEQMGADDGTNETTGAFVTCPIPENITVFPGLSASLTVAGGKAMSVPTLPLSAVLGTGDSGVVFVVDDSGEPTEQEVELGLSDEQAVEIGAGLTEGEEVLLHAPGKVQDIDCDDPEMFDPLFCDQEFIS